MGWHISKSIFECFWFQRVNTLCFVQTYLSWYILFLSHNMWKHLRICLDKAPRLSIRHDIWILSSSYYLSALHFQIVRRQCSLHKLVDVVMSFCTDKRYISTCVLRLSRQLPPTLISTTFNTYNWIWTAIHHCCRPKQAVLRRSTIVVDVAVICRSWSYQVVTHTPWWASSVICF